MTKVKSSTKKEPSTPKGNIKSIKEPVIGKNKTPKFKNTPTGKVALINGSTKGDGKKNSSKISAQNGKGQSPQKKQNNSNGKQNSPKNKKKLTVQAQKSPGDKQNIKKSGLNLESENDSDSDINEGITIKEEVSGIEDHDESDEEDDDDEDKPGLTDILGDSLANESDEDDDDFEEDDDEDENDAALGTKHKGVKMFKGLKTQQIAETIESDKDGEEDNDNDDDEDDDDDDEEDDEEEVESGPGLKVLLGNSLADDDDDDDFDENDEDDDDEDITDEDEEEEEEAASPAKKQNLSPAIIKKKVSEDSIDDDDDDDDEDEDEDEDEGEGEGEAEDEDVDTPRLTKEEIEERNKRSIYIGNVPKDVTTNEITKVFSKYGPIETIRVRGAIPENPKMSLKGAAITKKIHPKVSTIYMFILFKSEESVQKALEMNGKQLNGNYLRVDICRTVKDGLYDTKKAVFIGNLPFDANDNMIWTHFADCGKITSVRVVKDNKTGIGRGFGYINFETPDDVTLALKLDGSKIGNREIRVKLCEKRAPNKNWQSNAGKRQFQGKRQYGGSPKKFKNDSGDSNQSSPNDRRKAGKRSQGEQQRQNTEGGSPRGKGRASFQGQKSDVKKVSQQGKFEKKKKIMAAKLTSKPKKPMTN